MSVSLFDLTGETALVTGAAGGVGAVLARGLAAAGAAVALADIDGDRMESVRREISALGGECISLEVDVTRVDQCDEMVEKTEEKLGIVSVLVNSAGTNIRGTLEEVDEVGWDQVLDLNLKATFFATRSAGRGMKRLGRGKVVNIASLMARSVFANPNGQTYGPYSASKGGVVSLTRALSVEWGSHNIQVNALCPTFLDTRLTRVLLDDPIVRQAILDRAPNHAVGMVEDLVGPCIFLASSASNMVTGTALFVDGGWHVS
jgi:NAD(P)-dependent dehydrogenase (short-subunit alcohol dehydrogenase family)